MDELTCLLMDTAKQLKSNLTKSLKPFNVTCRQAIVLRTVEKESMSAKGIGKACFMDKATLSVILDKLIEHKYIECEKNKEDKREKVYSITKDGIDILPRVADVEKDIKGDLTSRISEKDYDTLVSLLSSVKEAL